MLSKLSDNSIVAPFCYPIHEQTKKAADYQSLWSNSYNRRLSVPEETDKNDYFEDSKAPSDYSASSARPTAGLPKNKSQIVLHSEISAVRKVKYIIIKTC